jgi:hypothetical protein
MDAYSGIVVIFTKDEEDGKDEDVEVNHRQTGIN